MRRQSSSRPRANSAGVCSSSDGAAANALATEASLVPGDDVAGRKQRSEMPTLACNGAMMAGTPTRRKARLLALRRQENSVPRQEPDGGEMSHLPVPAKASTSLSADTLFFPRLFGKDLGVVLGLVGLDSITAQPRLTFGRVELIDGIGLGPVMMGLFGGAQVLLNTEQVIKRDVSAPRSRSCCRRCARSASRSRWMRPRELLACSRGLSTPACVCTPATLCYCRPGRAMSIKR
jgi:hypothetical protein